MEEQLIQTFIDRLRLPQTPAAKPFILGVLGNIGSGKSTVSRMLAEAIPGAVVVQTNSARHILHEAGMGWGEQVHRLTGAVIRYLIGAGYAVILDGGTADADDRRQLAVGAAELHVPLMFVRVRCETEVCRLRTQRRYDDESWESSFDDFRVNTTEKMVANVLERAKVHHHLDSADIEGLVDEIDGNGPLENLDGQILEAVGKIRKKLG